MDLMPKRPLVRTRELPYHVYNRVNNREWFQLPMSVVWNLFCRELYRIRYERDVRIHAFVLMSNHFHALLSTYGDDLGVVMQHFGQSVTQTFNFHSGRVGHLFNGTYRWSLIQSPAHYANVMKYCYRNPVKAGITRKVEEYEFSTLHGLTGRAYLPIPIDRPHESVDDELIPEDSTALLAWLNRPFINENETKIRMGLRRRVFRVSQERARRAPSDLDRFLG
jgi:REP element-mobilizing transposase RayT